MGKIRAIICISIVIGMYIYKKANLFTFFVFSESESSINTPSAIEIIEQPTIDNHYVIKKISIFPRTVALYNDVTVSCLTENIGNIYTHGLYLNILKNPITLTKFDQLDITYKYSWGRYEDAIAGVV